MAPIEKNGVTVSAFATESKKAISVASTDHLAHVCVANIVTLSPGSSSSSSSDNTRPAGGIRWDPTPDRARRAVEVALAAAAARSGRVSTNFVHSA